MSSAVHQVISENDMNLELNSDSIPMVSIPSTMDLHINLTKHSDAQTTEISDITCELFHLASGTKSSVRVTQRKDKHTLIFTPLHRGRYELRVSINGQLLKAFPLSVAPHPDSLKNPTVLISGLKELFSIAINSSNHIIVSEMGIGASQISTFDRKGKELQFFRNPRSSFVSPMAVGITVDTQDNTDSDDSIQKFSQEGLLLSRAGSHGQGHLQFDQHIGIAYNKTNDLVYIADFNNHRIQVLNSDLSFHSTFDKHGDFNHPTGVCCDGTGNLYVNDSGNHRVKVFSSLGEFLFTHRFRLHDQPSILHIGAGAVLVYAVDIAHHCVHTFTLGGEFVGSFGEQVLRDPVAVAIDCEQNIIVADESHGTILLF